MDYKERYSIWLCYLEYSFFVIPFPLSTGPNTLHGSQGNNIYIIIKL